MFNDALGLTKAVLEGRKTQTRRVATYEELPDPFDGWLIEGKDVGKRAIGNGEETKVISRYALNEVVAIAQSYEDIVKEYEAKSMYASAARLDQLYSRCQGWTNKMFVKADEMPHRIKITTIHVEKLQDISIMDVYKEGIALELTTPNAYKAFVELLKKIDSKMWAANPYVFVYEFDLVE